MSLASKDRPVFVLHVDSAAVRYRLWINDYMVAKSVALPMTQEFPVSEYIVDGENTITLTVKPANKDAEITVSLLVKPAAAGPKRKLKIATIACSGNSIKASSVAGSFRSAQGMTLVPVGEPPGDVQVSEIEIDPDDDDETEYWIYRDVTLPSPYPRWAWQDAEVLKEDDATTSSVVAEVRRVWRLLADGDVSAINALVQAKVTELSAAYHEDRPTKKAQFAILPQLMKAARLQPLPETMQPKFSCDNRLVELLDENDESPIVFMTGKAGDVGCWCRLLWCRVNGRWLLIR